MKRKYDPLLHAFFDHTGIARHLEKRARQGWMLDYIRTNTFFRYRRCDPKDLRFAVTYFPTASEFSAPEDDQKEFYDLCAAAGWQFVAQTFQMQIFCNEDPNAVPLETDPKVQLENIHASLWRNYMGGKFAVLAMSLIMLFNIGVKFENRLFATMRSMLYLLLTLLFLLLLLHQGLEVAAYYLWRKKALRAAEEQGLFLPVPGGRVREVFFTILYILIAVALLAHMPRKTGLLFLFGIAAFLLIVQLAFSLRDALKKRGVKTGWNYFFTILLIFALTCGRTAVEMLVRNSDWLEEDTPVSIGMLPITVEALGQSDNENYDPFYGEEGSPFASTVNGGQLPKEGKTENPRFFYYVHRSPQEWILNHSKKWQVFTMGFEFLSLRPTNDQRIDPAPFGAREAWMRIERGDPEYLLCYEGCVIQLGFGWEPTEEQLILAAETLLREG